MASSSRSSATASPTGCAPSARPSPIASAEFRRTEPDPNGRNSRRARPLLLPLLLSTLAACRCVALSPNAIREAPAPAEEIETALDAWRGAVALANAFLASPFRRTLPEGRFDLDDAEGMRFVTSERTWPIEVRSTTWGDLVLWSGFQAQERSFGFVVGAAPPDDVAVLHNSFFRTREGVPLPADSIARLVLHETAHVVFREGTIGFWNSLAYYLEAIFLLRSRNHSDEALPRAVSEEFTYFRFWPDGDPEWRAKALEMLEAHLADQERRCRHGPVPTEE